MTEATDKTPVLEDRHEGQQIFGLELHSALILGATLLGLAIRVVVGLKSEVWLDEANSVLIALSSLGDFAETLRPDSSPPLYYLALKVWALLVPTDPFWLRIPSIFFGCLTIPMIGWVGREMDRPETGSAAAWLIAVNPLHVYYSEEIRMYAMLALFSLVFYYALFHRLKKFGNIFLATIVGIVLTYTHYYGLVFAGIGFLFALGVCKEQRRAVFISGSLVGLAFLPWLPVFLTQLDNPHHVSWIGPFWDRYPGGFAIFRTLQTYLPGGMKYAFVPLRGLSSQWVPLGLGLAPFALLALGENRREVARRLWLPAAMTGATLAVLVLRSYTGTPVYLVGRSDIVVFPLLLLIMATAVGRLKQLPKAIFIVAWIGASGFELLRSAESLMKKGNEEIATVLEESGCTTVIATGLSYATVLFYEMNRPGGALVVAYPQDVADHPGNLNPARYTPVELEAQARRLAQEHPPGLGLCLVVPPGVFRQPLATAYLESGANAQLVGTFGLSVMQGMPYEIVHFPDP